MTDHLQWSYQLSIQRRDLSSGKTEQRMTVKSLSHLKADSILKYGQRENNKGVMGTYSIVFDRTPHDKLENKEHQNW